MKRIFVIFFLFILFQSHLNAQFRDRVEYKQNWDMQQVFWGYYLGLNKKSYKINYTTNNAFVSVI